MIEPQTRLNLDFEIEVILNGAVKQVPFKSLLKERTFVSVYMRNNTGACDKQVEAMIAEAENLAGKGVALIGVSRDRALSHLKYAEKKGVPFPLVSDPADFFSKAADAIIEKTMYGKTFKGPTRAAYLLDKEGVVLAIVPQVNAAHHGKQLQACVV